MMDFQLSAFLEAFPDLMKGAGKTVTLASVSLTLGMALGTAIGVIRTFGTRSLSFIAQVYIGLIRGTPLVVQIMCIYFALPMAFDIRMSATTAGVIALMVNSSAYLAEIVRGGFIAVPKGLKEAGQAMGLSMGQVITSIIAPVAFRRMVPALGNQFIIGLKDTSLLIVIGVAELTRTGQEIMTQSYRAVEVWSAVALIYLGIISVLALAMKLVEKRVEIA